MKGQAVCMVHGGKAPQALAKAQAVMELADMRQLEQRLAAGKSWQDFDYVFTNRKGTPLEARTVWRAFKRILAKAGLRDQRFHNLRHAAATLMLSEGVNPKVVAEMLGHRKIAVAMDLYSHVTPAMQVDAVSRIDAALATIRRG